MCIIFFYYLFSSCGSLLRRRPWSLSCDHGLHCSDGIVREQQQHPAEYQDSSNYGEENSNKRGHAASLIMQSYNTVFTQVSYCLITSVPCCVLLRAEQQHGLLKQHKNNLTPPARCGSLQRNVRKMKLYYIWICRDAGCTGVFFSLSVWSYNQQPTRTARFMKTIDVPNPSRPSRPSPPSPQLLLDRACIPKTIHSLLCQDFLRDAWRIASPI